MTEAEMQSMVRQARTAAQMYPHVGRACLANVESLVAEVRRLQEQNRELTSELELQMETGALLERGAEELRAENGELRAELEAAPTALLRRGTLVAVAGSAVSALEPRPSRPRQSERADQKAGAAPISARSGRTRARSRAGVGRPRRRRSWTVQVAARGVNPAAVLRLCPAPIAR